MRKVMTGAAILMLLPAVAQAQPGKGRGGGPPITPPGQAGAGGIDRGQMGRDIGGPRGQFGAQQRPRSDARRDAARQNADRGRQAPGRPDATGLSKARQVAAPQAQFGLSRAEMARLQAEDFARIEQDLQNWRRDFRIGRTQWQMERDRWIELRRSTSPEQWMAVRQNWMARHAEWQQLRDQWRQKHLSRQRHSGMGGPLDIDD